MHGLTFNSIACFVAIEHHQYRSACGVYVLNRALVNFTLGNTIGCHLNCYIHNFKCWCVLFGDVQLHPLCVVYGCLLHYNKTQNNYICMHSTSAQNLAGSLTILIERISVLYIFIHINNLKSNFTP